MVRAARWSSLVARRAHNPKVGGSNPPRATKAPPTGWAFFLRGEDFRACGSRGVETYVNAARRAGPWRRCKSFPRNPTWTTPSRLELGGRCCFVGQEREGHELAAGPAVSTSLALCAACGASIVRALEMGAPMNDLGTAC